MRRQGLRVLQLSAIDRNVLVNDAHFCGKALLPGQGDQMRTCESEHGL